MTSYIIRYRTHADRIAENRRLVEGVFAELRERPLPGLHYRATLGPDGVFTHFVSFDDGVAGAQLQKLGAFSAFQAGLRERCVEPPVRTEVTLLGSFG